MINQVFGELLVLSRGDNQKKHPMYLCLCSCGVKKLVRGSHMRAGKIRSCGHIRATHALKHGESSTRLYKIWINMLSRCNKPTDAAYLSYGGRGIHVVKDWEDFAAFKQWADQSGYREDLTIDRIDNNKGYCPDNCQWSTYSTQASNRRKISGTFSQYVGVFPIGDKWRVTVTHKNIPVVVGFFNTELEAAQQRDLYIKENKLPHRLNFE